MFRTGALPTIIIYWSAKALEKKYIKVHGYITLNLKLSTMTVAVTCRVHNTATETLHS